MMKSPQYLDGYAEPADIAAVVLRISELDEPAVLLLVSSAAYDYALSVEIARTQVDE